MFLEQGSQTEFKQKNAPWATIERKNSAEHNLLNRFIKDTLQTKVLF